MRLQLTLVVLYFVVVQGCILPSPIVLQLIVEYAKWRSWEEMVLFTDQSSINFCFNFVRPLIDCLNDEGISATIQSPSHSNVREILHIRRHRIGSVVLLDGLNFTVTNNVLHVASQKLLFNYYVSWLMISTQSDDATIDTLLRDLNISIDSDVVVATSPLTHNATNNLTRDFLNRTCPSIRRYGTIFSFKEPPPRKVEENALANLSFSPPKNETVFFYLVQTYKIRNSDNTSLVTQPLGSWTPGHWPLKKPLTPKLRNDLKGYPIIFGVLNGTNDGQTEPVDEVEANDIAPLVDYANFITDSINARVEMVHHEKLGVQNNKVWSHLLGDVVSGDVDVGLGYITINDERLAEMTFSLPLVRYMRNVYYHPLETGIMRDIFRQPFNNYLLGCVATTYLVILIAMGMIIYAAKTSLRHGEEKNVGIGEAALWCISIMCMQGSPWTPKSPSGKTLLLFSLMFALVTYNAYAGFITSILSVQASGIKSITDLLSHNFKLGYSVTDDEYIRNVNDSHLRQLYIKAFNNRESRLDTLDGLMKAVDGHYGFFVSATLARRVLKTTLIQERCTLRELALHQTFTVVALPMANNSPYKKLINLHVLRIRERGVLTRISNRMLPEMPLCKSPTTFHSARLADVYSAFFILMAGLVAAVSIGIVERIWNKRRQMQATIVRGMRQHHLMPHLPHLPHLPNFPHVPNQPPLQYFSQQPSHDYQQDQSRIPVAGGQTNYNGVGMNVAQGSNTFAGDKVQEKSGNGMGPSRIGSRSSAWKRHSATKRTSWASFSGLRRKKNKEVSGGSQVAPSNASVFPFQL